MTGMDDQNLRSDQLYERSHAAIIAAGMFCVFMPLWVALIRQLWPYADWLGMPDLLSNNLITRASWLIGGRPIIVFGIPMLGGAVAASFARISQVWKFAIVASLFPAVVFQCFIIGASLALAGRLP
jgi:hypothetical protein